MLPFRGGRAGGIWSYAGVLERRLLGTMVLLLLLSGFSYIYFVMTSVAHVAQREETAHKVASLSAEVARLESAYLTQSQTVTESYARTLGYVTPTSRTFVEKTSLALSRDASR